MNQDKNQIGFSHARKKTRGELRLPQLHFVAVDQWVHVLGNHALIAWLQFYSWADRADKDRECDAIPTSMRGIAERLKVSRDTLYKKIIRPLWNYGMIDLIETSYDGYSNVNIVVYEYPQNDPTLATKELVQIRNYDTEYISVARQKSIQIAEQREKQLEEGRYENQTGGAVRKSDRKAVRKSDRGGTKIRPINYKDESSNVVKINNEQQQNKNAAVVDSKLKIIERIESALGTSVNSLLPQLKTWVEKYGAETLIAKAQYIGDSRSKWHNIIGTYRTAVEQNWDTAFSEVAATIEKPHSVQNERYASFYALFDE